MVKTIKVRDGFHADIKKRMKEGDSMGRALERAVYGRHRKYKRY